MGQRDEVSDQVPIRVVDLTAQLPCKSSVLESLELIVFEEARSLKLVEIAVHDAVYLVGVAADLGKRAFAS